MNRYVEASNDRVSALQLIREQLETLLHIADRWDESLVSAFLCQASHHAENALQRAEALLQN